jgi:hypothetical protein
LRSSDFEAPMSLMGQKATSTVRPSMSALHPQADVPRTRRNVCFVPKADISAALFDHLVGNRKQVGRHGEAKLLCGL